MNGRLIEAVAFDAPDSQLDGQGGTEEGWTQMHDCRAGFLYLRGGEVVQAARLAGKQPVVVTIRKCQAALAITTGWRMRDTRRGDEYNVRSNVPTDDRKYLELACEKGVAV